MALAVLDGNTPDTTGSYNNGVKDVMAKQTEVVVADRENVEAALIESGYYEKSEFTGLQ
jgi:putative multiple sugar transport system substrate-binding protein